MQTGFVRSLLSVLMLSLLLCMGAASSIVQAAANPRATATKVTLYVGYNDYQIRFSNLSKSAAVTYKSSNKKIAAVSGKGVITPKSEGNTSVTVTMKQNKKTYISKIEVIVKDPYVSITDIPKEFETGLTYQLKSKAEGLNKPTLTWSSSDPDAAAVDSKTGELTAHKTGKAKITLMDTDSGTKDTIEIEVKKYQPISVSYNFKKGIPGNVSGRGPVKIEKVKKDGYDTIYVTNRNSFWQGIQIDITKDIGSYPGLEGKYE